MHCNVLHINCYRCAVSQLHATLHPLGGFGLFVAILIARHTLEGKRNTSEVAGRRIREYSSVPPRAYMGVRPYVIRLHTPADHSLTTDNIREGMPRLLQDYCRYFFSNGRTFFSRSIVGCNEVYSRLLQLPQRFRIRITRTPPSLSGF